MSAVYRVVLSVMEHFFPKTNIYGLSVVGDSKL